MMVQTIRKRKESCQAQAQWRDCDDAYPGHRLTTWLQSRARALDGSSPITSKTVDSSQISGSCHLSSIA